MNADILFRWVGVVGVAALVPIAMASSAQAQSIDYGALENLFGEPVITSATGTPQRASEVPVTMEIVTAEDIRRSGATDIPGVLRNLAGVDVIRISPSQSEVAVRGYSQPMADSRLMVLINGRQVFANIFSTVLWSTIPVQLEEIRQIEVVKGPSSALYGFNAAAGVINIITYNPLYDDTNLVHLRAGTHSDGQASTIGTARVGDTAVRLSAGGLTAADPGPIVRSAQDIQTKSPTERGMGAVDAVSQIGDQMQLRIEANAVQDRGRYFGLQLPLQGTADTVSGKAQLLAETPIGLVDANIYRNIISAQVYSPELPARAQFNEETTVANIQDQFKWGASDSFRLTAEYRHSAIPTFVASGGNLTADIGSAGGMWDHAVNERLSVLSAHRLDVLKLDRTGTFLAAVPYTNQDYDRTVYGYSFNEATVWRATGRDTFRASVGRGLQLPSLGEYGTMSVGAPPLAAVYGNPNLLPSMVDNVELSYDRQLPEIEASSRVSLFRQWSDHLRGVSLPQMDAQGQLIEYHDEIGSSRTNGIEAGLQGRIGPHWQWNTNLTWQLIHDSIIVNASGIDYAHETPQMKGNARLGYTDGPWECDLWGNYASSTLQATDAPALVAPAERLHDYWVLSPRVAYRFSDDVTLDLTASSLWNYRDNPLARTQRDVLMSILVKF